MRCRLSPAGKWFPMQYLSIELNALTGKDLQHKKWYMKDNDTDKIELQSQN
jgi:hypothetical protein